MATNGTDIALETRLPVDKTAAWKRTQDNRAPDADYLSSAGAADPSETGEDFALAPLVDKIAYGIARGLIVAVRELEHHIANEARKVGDAVDRRLDALQISMQELSRFVTEQRSTNSAVQDQLQQLTVGGDGLREADARQAAELETLREETRASANSVAQRIDVTVASLQEADARQATGLLALQDETRALSQSIAERIDSLCRELGVHQEDIDATKATLATFCSRVDAHVERLDRQAEAVRSMYSAYSQRETELEQLVDGLARLRAYPTPLPTNGL